VDLPGDLERWLPVVLVAALAVPAVIGVAWLLFRTRIRKGVGRTDALRRTVAEVGMVAGTVPWLWMILTPIPGEGLVHLVPFEDLAGQLERPLSWVFFQVTGNLLVFAAFGLLAPVRWPIGPWRVLGIAALASASVEFLQWALDLGRVASVDDVLLNAGGAALAALCSRRWWALQGAGS